LSVSPPGEQSTFLAVDWSSLPFYVVGNATATPLRSLRDIYDDSCLVPKDIRGESGTGERLAHFILEDVPRSESSLKTKLLYLTGDKNRDTIPNILQDGGLDVECLKVYETHCSPNLPRDLGKVVKSSSKGAPNFPFFLV
jgi:uroporphyrinogen-III synthase